MLLLPTEIESLPETARYAGRIEDRFVWRGSTNETTDKTARFVLASGKEVRHNPIWQDGGDVIVIREMRLAKFRENPVVLADHNWTQIVGRGSAEIVKLADDEHQLQGAVDWDLSDDNPLARLVAGQHARGMRNAVSIGFMPGKGSVNRTKLPTDHEMHMDPEKTQSWRAGMLFRFSELWEYSSVAIPKDPTALQLRSWAAESEGQDDRVARIVNEILDRRSAELVMSAYTADKTLRRKIVADVLAELPAPALQTPAVDPETAFWDSK